MSELPSVKIVVMAIRTLNPGVQGPTLGTPQSELPNLVGDSVLFLLLAA